MNFKITCGISAIAYFFTKSIYPDLCPIVLCATGKYKILDLKIMNLV